MTESQFEPRLQAWLSNPGLGRQSYSQGLSGGLQAPGNIISSTTVDEKSATGPQVQGKTGRGYGWAGRAWLGKSSGHSGSLRRKQNGDGNRLLLPPPESCGQPSQAAQRPSLCLPQPATRLAQGFEFPGGGGGPATTKPPASPPPSNHHSSPQLEEEVSGWLWLPQRL